MADEESVAIPAPPVDLKRKLDEVETDVPDPHAGSDDGSNGVILDDSKAASDFSQAKRPKLDDEAADRLDNGKAQENVSPVEVKERDEEPNEEETAQKDDNQDSEPLVVEVKDPIQSENKTCGVDQPADDHVKPDDNQKSFIEAPISVDNIVEECKDVNGGEPQKEVNDESKELNDGTSHKEIGKENKQVDGEDPQKRVDDTQSTTRRIDVPSSKVGVLIGKGGETVRHLQFKSGAKIQILRDSEADPNSALRPVETIKRLGAYIWPEEAEQQARRALKRNLGCRQSRPKMGTLNTVLPDYPLRFKASQSSPKATRHGSSGPGCPPSRGVIVGLAADPQAAARRRAEKCPEGPAAIATLPDTDTTAIVPRSKSMDAGRRRKRSGDHLEADGAMKKSRAAGHSFSFKYDESEVPFLANAPACARFIRSVKGGTSFKLDKMLEAGAFEDASKKLCSAIGAMNRLANSYEHRIRRSEGEESEKALREALKAEEEKTARAEGMLLAEERKSARIEEMLLVEERKNDELEERVADLEAKLVSEVARLREFRSMGITTARNRALNEAIRVFQPRLDKIKRYVDEFAAAQEDLQLFAQVDGTLKCVRILIKNGVAVPPATVKKLEKDWAELNAKVKDLEVIDLEDGDWDAKTLYERLSERCSGRDECAGEGRNGCREPRR